METQAVSTLNPSALAARQRAGLRALHRLLGNRSAFALHGPNSSGRPELEAYIGRCFRRAYGASVTEFAPQLLALSCAGRISGVAGIRPASRSRLFLEQYLDESVEELVARRMAPVARDRIVELGNLAALRPGACQLINILLAAVLQRAGFSQAGLVCTAKLEGIIRKQGFSLQSIARADPTRLGCAAADWGTYYDTNPTILFVDLDRTMAALRTQRMPAAFLHHYRLQITDLGDRLAEFSGVAGNAGAMA